MFIFFLCICIFFCPGCITPRLADTHNTTAAVQSYNTWVSSQAVFDRETRRTIAEIGNHINAYNTEITGEQPDYSVIRQDLGSDQQLVDQWGKNLDNLSDATALFEENTAKLTYDNASTVKVREQIALMAQYMKIYAADMGNARQHLIDYVNRAESYTGPDNPDYWNEKYRQAAMQAKEQARYSVADADLALSNLTAHARNLEQLQ